MKLYFEQSQIEIPDKFIGKKKKIVQETAQVDFLSGIHFSDVQKEISAIKEICKILKEKYRVKKVNDLMAGCGFSGMIFKKYLECELMLNDLSEVCYQILKLNFEMDSVTNVDVFKMPGSRLRGMTFVDFNNFTINKIKYWHKLLNRISKASELMMITDSAIYGFKFGNLSRYGCEERNDYYYLLKDTMKKEYGWNLSFVTFFGPAALVLFDKLDTDKITFIEESKPICIRKKKGLGL